MLRQSSTTIPIRASRPGLTEITDLVAQFVAQSGMGDGLLTLFCRHTSASLIIQEDAAPAARRRPTAKAPVRGLGVGRGRFAKAVGGGAGPLLFPLAAGGAARLDNRKCKNEFGARPRMLGPDETYELTGHPVGGVCPFGLK